MCDCQRRSPLQQYAEGGRTRVPKKGVDAATEQGGRDAFEILRGFFGAPSQASVMRPGEVDAYGAGETAGLAASVADLIPAKGAASLLPIALGGVIKRKGGNWISLENAIKNMQHGVDPSAPDHLEGYLEIARRESPELVPQYEAGLARAVRQLAIDKWLAGPLAKYVKNQLATPEDPVRLLAEQGIHHRNDGFASPVSLRASKQREKAGFPVTGLGKSQSAQDWEAAADQAILVDSADSLRQMPSVLGRNPWMSNLAPETPVYAVDSLGLKQSLGFDHVVDELQNAMDPASGLPHRLRISPEQLGQYGMEKAVRRVHDINEWRAAQKSAADAELANRATVVREYSDNNPKGLRWVELKAADPDAFEQSMSHLKGREWDDAMAKFRTDRVEELKRQLKYEGDTMGHCVGGYCDDVLNGNSRIFSLRDAKGEPHVTIEVEGNPPVSGNEVMSMFGDRGREIWDAYVENIHQYPTVREFMRDQYPDEARQFFAPRIKQIKGKANLKPIPEYIPFVQDFIRKSPVNEEWSRVGDLRNTDLRDMRGLYGAEYPSGLPRYMTLEEQRKFNIDYPNVGTRISRDLDSSEWEPDGGYAEGGLVDAGVDDPVAFALQWQRKIDALNGYKRT